MRRRKSRSVAIGSVAARLLGGRLRYRGGETLLEFTDGFFDFGSDAVVESFFLGNIFQDGRGAGFDVFQHFLLETAHFVDGNVIEQAARGDRIDAAGYLLGIGASTDRTAGALKPIANDPRRLVAAAVNTPEYLTS